MKTLTFDTSLNKTYITLSEDENVTDSRILDSTDEKYHSAYLIPSIVDVLKKNNITMQDIKAIGTNIGPGSFTGIRVCNTISRVFAQALDIKLLGFSSLEILSKINTTDKSTLVLLDARKEKVYEALYSKEGKELKAPCATLKEDILKYDFNEYFIVTDNSIKNFLTEKGISATSYEEKEYELGKYLAKLTSDKLKKSDDNFNWAEVKPLYIQPPSISKPKAR